MSKTIKLNDFNYEQLKAQLGHNGCITFDDVVTRLIKYYGYHIRGKK